MNNKETIMISSFSRNVLAGALVLTLASPGWAAETAKEAGATAQEAKMERKAMAKGSEEIRKLQEALKTKGEDPGVVDGILGKKTHAALKTFQEANGLKGSGKLDDQTAQKLGVEKDQTLAKKEMKEEKK